MMTRVPSLLTLQTVTSIVDSMGRPTPWFIQYELQGFTGVVPVAKLTGGGVNGTLTIFNGKIVAVKDPT
jgi:hypothetical protein